MVCAHAAVAALGHGRCSRGRMWTLERQVARASQYEQAPRSPTNANTITTNTKIRRTHDLSHIVEIKTEIKDEQAVKAACARLNLPLPEHKTVRLFNATATGLAVQLPNWSYPVVCNLETGQEQYDNYGGHWGEQARLNQFLQAYAVEKAKIEARRKGHTCFETRLEDGSIRVTVRVGGAA